METDMPVFRIRETRETIVEFDDRPPQDCGKQWWPRLRKLLALALASLWTKLFQ